jgi:hypothetical protein
MSGEMLRPWLITAMWGRMDLMDTKVR